MPQAYYARLLSRPAVLMSSVSTYLAAAPAAGTPRPYSRNPYGESLLQL